MRALLAALSELRIYVKNPHDTRARIVVRPGLPPLLAKRDWQFAFTSPGGSAFSLEPRTGRDVVMRLMAGEPFAAEDLKEARNCAIHVEVYADDILVGGMSYTLDPAPEA